jgi:hypothetical protein
MVFCPKCRHRAPEDFPDPDCLRCGGEGLVGDPEACTVDWPLCESRWFNGTGREEDDWLSCSCDNGLPARLNRYQEAHDRKVLLYLADRVLLRCWTQERQIYALLQEPGVSSGLEMAQDILKTVQAGVPRPNYRHASTYAFQEGMKFALRQVERRLAAALTAAREEVGLDPTPQHPVCTDMDAPRLADLIDQLGGVR